MDDIALEGDFVKLLCLGSEGFRLVCNRVEHGKEICGFMVRFWEEIAKVEETYARSLLEVCDSSIANFDSAPFFLKLFVSNPLQEVGAMNVAWNHLKDQLKKIASTHLNAAEKIGSLVYGPILEFTRASEIPKKKAMAEGWQLWEQLKIERSQLSKAQEAYYMKSNEYSSATKRYEKGKQSPTISSERLQLLEERMMKLKEEVTNLENKYQLSVEKNRVFHKKFYSKGMPDLFERLEQQEANRLTSINKGLSNFIMLQEERIKVETQCVDLLKQASEAVDVRRVLQEFTSQSLPLDPPPLPAPVTFLSFEMFLQQRNQSSPYGQVKINPRPNPIKNTSKNPPSVTPKQTSMKPDTSSVVPFEDNKSSEAEKHDTLSQNQSSFIPLDNPPEYIVEDVPTMKTAKKSKSKNPQISVDWIDSILSDEQIPNKGKEKHQLTQNQSQSPPFHETTTTSTYTQDDEQGTWVESILGQKSTSDLQTTYHDQWNDSISYNQENYKETPASFQEQSHWHENASNNTRYPTEDFNGYFQQQTQSFSSQDSSHFTMGGFSSVGNDLGNITENTNTWDQTQQSSLQSSYDSFSGQTQTFEDTQYRNVPSEPRFNVMSRVVATQDSPLDELQTLKKLVFDNDFYRMFNIDPHYDKIDAKNLARKYEALLKSFDSVNFFYDPKQQEEALSTQKNATHVYESVFLPVANHNLYKRLCLMRERYIAACNLTGQQQSGPTKLDLMHLYTDLNSFRNEATSLRPPWPHSLVQEIDTALEVIKNELEK